jgi:hypothetical protein
MINRLIVALTFAASLSAVHAQTPNTLTDCEKQDGFKLLFDGTIESYRANFTEYKQNSTDNTLPISSQWKVEAATSAIVSGPSQPDLRSKDMFKDFDMRLQYRNDANQGIFYRCLNTAADAWQTGIEVAIEDNVNIANQKTAAGAVYDMFAPSVKNYNAFASEKWNDLRIIAKGDSVEHWMNGAKIVSFKYHSAAWWAAFDKSKWTGFPTYCMKVPGNRNSGPILEGYIGVQGNHGGKWKLRNFRINSTATVNFNPEKAAGSCSSPISAAKADAVKTTVTFERAAGAIKVNISGAKVDAISLVELNGREVVRGKVEAGAQTASLSGWGHPGVYLIKASAAGRSVISDKVFLQ